MTILVPTCEQFTSLLTDYEEGALGPLDWLGMKLHLALCPPCQTFLRSFERTPALLRQAWDGTAEAPAERALASALAALREGRQPRGPQHHPPGQLTHFERTNSGTPMAAAMAQISAGWRAAPIRARWRHPRKPSTSAGEKKNSPLPALNRKP